MIGPRRSIALLGALGALAAASPAAGAPGDAILYDIPVETTPYGITTGPDGRIWFLDSGNHVGGASVGRMRTDGSIAPTDVIPLATEELALGIAPGPDGNLWVRQDTHVSKVPPDADETSDITGWTTSATGGWGHIVAGPDGRMWFSVDTAVGAITMDGDVQEYPSGASGTTADVRGLIVGPDGKLWFANDREIRRMSAEGVVGPGDVFPLPEGHEGVTDMTLGPDGNVWFTISGPATVGKVTPDGDFTTFATPTTGSLPFGIFTGPDGYMWFAERNAGGIGSIPTSATSGADIDEYPSGTPNGPLDIVAGPDDRMWAPLFNSNQILATETNVSPAAPPPGDGGTPPPGPPPGEPGPIVSPGPPLPANPSPVGCAPGRLILTDVFPSGGRTRLLGVAPAAAVGERVTIRSKWNGRRVARPTVAPDLSFTASVPLPPKRLRGGNRARYRAAFGSTRSQALKFSRRMYTTSITASGSTVRFKGVVTKPLADPAERVVVRASSTCADIARAAIVATTTPSRSGAFTASFELPPALASAQAVFLRAQTKVRKKGARRKKLFDTFTLIRGISTGAAG